MTHCITSPPSATDLSCRSCLHSAASTLPDPAQTGAAKRLRLEDYFARFAEYLAARGCGEKYISRNRNYLRRLFTMMGCERVEKVRAEDVEKVILRLRGEGKRWKTVRDYVGCLGHFFNWGMKRGYWDRNPVAAVELPQRFADSVPRRALTPQEIKRLLDACPNKERRLLYLTALYTGLRQSAPHLCDAACPEWCFGKSWTGVATPF